jgi:hypothetical protein
VAVEERSLTIRMDYANFEDYWQPFLGGQGPVGTYFTNLAPALKARIKEAVRDAYCSGSPDGPRSLTASAWAVQGTAPSTADCVYTTVSHGRDNRMAPLMMPTIE